MELSDKASQIQESSTMAAANRARDLQAQGKDVVSFTVGQPDFDTPVHIKEAASKAMSAGRTGYPPSAGVAELKEAICRKFQRDNRLHYKPSQVLVSSGAKHSLHNAFTALCDPGDEVLLPVPYWVSYPEMVRLVVGVPVPIEGHESNHFKITPDQLRDAVTPETKVLVLNSPSNPTGSVYSPTELRALAEVVLQTGLAIVSDEIYEKLTYGDTVFQSFASLDPALVAQTITINGVSKSHAMTGWRIGYAAGPEPVIKAMSNIQSQQTSGACHISQYAALAALESDQDCVEQMRQEFDRRRQYLIERLDNLPDVRCCEPAGAFYAFPNVSGHYGRQVAGSTINGSADFCDVCLNEAYVAMVPGEAFGADPCVRLSFATSLDRIREGLDRLEKLLG